MKKISKKVHKSHHVFAVFVDIKGARGVGGGDLFSLARVTNILAGGCGHFSKWKIGK